VLILVILMNSRLLGLPGRGDANDIDYYKEANPFDQKTTPEIEDKIAKMREHPSKYFNFGFTINDFRAYLLKAIYMRAERKVIERMFQEYEAKLSGK
jgi:hypothetical protein